MQNQRGDCCTRGGPIVRGNVVVRGKVIPCMLSLIKYVAKRKCALLCSGWTSRPHCRTRSAHGGKMGLKLFNFFSKGHRGLKKFLRLTPGRHSSFLANTSASLSDLLNPLPHNFFKYWRRIMALANPSSKPAPGEEASGWGREAGRPCKKHTHVNVHTEEATGGLVPGGRRWGGGYSTSVNLIRIFLAASGKPNV